MDDIKKYLEHIAGRECWEDELCDDECQCVDDYAGGNVDDAYEGGMRSGEVLLARILLHNYFK